jgi:hypothetical protein
MSGIFNKTLYDDCAFKQRTMTSVEPLFYELYNGKFENDITCKRNNGAKLANNWSTISTRTDVESELQMRTLPLTKCATEKYIACNYTGNNGKKSNSYTGCKNNVVITPVLCDRDIVPTNMRMPNSKGF